MIYGTTATMSCVITDITEQQTVTWYTSAGTQLSPTSDVFSVDTQTSVLEVAEAIEDGVYTCDVAGQPVEVLLDVLGTFFTAIYYADIL